MSSKRHSGDWSQQSHHNRHSLGKQPDRGSAPVQARGPAPAVHQAGGSASHRRRSDGYNTGAAEGSSRQSYHGQPSKGVNGRSYAARLEAEPALAQQIYESQARRSEYDDPLTPTSPQDRTEFSKDLIGQKLRDKRRASVPDRSPLQKLEVTLDDISKEEKRARLEEAEAAARERLATDPRYFRRVPDPVKPRTASGPADSHASSSRAVSGKRVSSAPTTAQPSTRQADPRLPVDVRQYDARHNGGHKVYPADANLAQAAVPAVVALKGKPVGRSNSRKLQKQPRADGQKPLSGKDQLNADRVGAAAGSGTASGYQEPDPLPRDAVGNRARDSAGPKYQIPPQTAAGQDAHDRVGFAQSQTVPLAAAAAAQQHHHHLGGVLHRHNQVEERRYQAPRPLDEWRSAQTAVLTADDINLDDLEGQDKGMAWWEKHDKQRRHSSGGRAVVFDGSVESVEGGRQTYFQPPLYLKCGPLLRYAGTQRTQSSKGNIREVWRGSVMIVTDDTQSHTEIAPTLRLFVQPQELLPPPPAQLSVESGQQLAPEYVDPLAGQVHISRIGKTLYVRPIDMLPEGVDLSRVENDTGLFEEKRSAADHTGSFLNVPQNGKDAQKYRKLDGEKIGKYREVKAIRLHQERSTTFWRFNLEIELGRHQTRVAYRINKGPAIGFWVPARGETMNVMFHSCNGFSLSVDSHQFCGPDPMWRDVLNNHQTRPFHVMIGGGDQIYNDAATKYTDLFREWCESRNPHIKHGTQFSVEMQEELEEFYCDRYAMWFSQGLFGMANGQIPMVNLWDDHDIIDGFGSYPHHFMSTPVFAGIGAVAFKYYMLFQHQSISAETEAEEPSWLLGASPGPYINELSRGLFMFMGRQLAFLGLDCRTERMKDEVLSVDTYDRVFERLRRELVRGETKHLLVLLGVPIAYPRLNFLENVLTSRAMDPVKALGRLGLFGNLLNKFDGGVEILDDLDDHWTAKHHKHERNWFIQELQELAAEKSVRVTILSGDVHLAAVGQFFSNKKLQIPKDMDHRYMPNIISSAIVNTPPPEMMSDILNKRNKLHHLDHDTDEDMIPLFTHDVDGKRRNNHRLLPRRNWCSIREYAPGSTPPSTPPLTPSQAVPPRRGSLKLTRSLSFGKNSLTRRLSRKNANPDPNRPPRAFLNTAGGPAANNRRASDPVLSRPTDNSTGYFTGVPPASEADPQPRPNIFHRVPTGLSERAALRGAQAGDMLDAHINLQHGLDVLLNLEVSQNDPAGITTPYRLLVPALEYEGPADVNSIAGPKKVGLGRWLSTKIRRKSVVERDAGYDSEFTSEGETTPGPRPLSGQRGPTGAGAARPFSYVGHDAAGDTSRASGTTHSTAPIPHVARAVPPAANQPTANEPERARRGSEAYGESRPMDYSDEDDYSDEEMVVRRKPLDRLLGRKGHGSGIGAGHGGVDGVREEKKVSWRTWR